VLNQSKYCT